MNIDGFLEKMEARLPIDLVTYIMKIVIRDANIEIIKKQKKLKMRMQYELVDVLNSYYSDNNIKLYKNNRDQFVVHPKNNNCRMMLFCNQGNQGNQLPSLGHMQNLLTEGNTTDEQNEVILFPSVNTDPNRRLKIFIVYI